MLPSPKMLVVISVVSYCSNWQFGYQITYINTAHFSFYDHADQLMVSTKGVHLARSDWNVQWSAILAAFYAGTLIGFTMVPRLIRTVGSVRNALLCSSFPAIVGCIIQLGGIRLATNLLMFDLLLSLGRLLVGIQAGCSLCLLPLFIIETCAAWHRPFLSSLQVVFQSLATLIGLIVGSDSLVSLGTRKLEWLQVIGLAPTLAFAAFLVCLPETPFRLLEKCQQMFEHCTTGDEEEDIELEFERSALFYYGTNVDFSAIRSEAFDRWRLPKEEPSSCQNSLVKSNWKGLLVGTVASISFAFTADDLIDSYSADFIHRFSHSSQANAEYLTAGLGALLFITSLFGAFIADRIGRRPMLIAGLLGTAFSNAGAAYGAVVSSTTVVTAGFLSAKAFIGIGAGAPAWFLTSELVSPLFLAQAQAISTGCLLLATGLCTLCFLPLQNWMGSANALLALSTIPALILASFLFIMLPETKGLSFRQINQLLTRHTLPGLHGTRLHARFFPSLVDSWGKTTASMDEWERQNWELPHRSQRLMNASSYVSYGSIRSVPTSAQFFGHFSPSNIFRRHSSMDPQHQQLSLGPPKRSSTFTNGK